MPARFSCSCLPVGSRDHHSSSPDHHSSSFPSQGHVLSPNSVWICWGEDPRYWRLSPLENSRFSQEAELLSVCWLQILATIDTRLLDNDTTYSVLYFFKHNDTTMGLETPAEVSLTEKDGKTICSRKVHLYPGSPDLIRREGEEWLALDVGRFQSTGVSRKITAHLLDPTTHWKSGLRFAGVEICAISALS